LKRAGLSPWVDVADVPGRVVVGAEAVSVVVEVGLVVGLPIELVEDRLGIVAEPHREMIDQEHLAAGGTGDRPAASRWRGGARADSRRGADPGQAQKQSSGRLARPDPATSAQMQGFRSPVLAKPFLAADAAVANTCTTCRHFISATAHRQIRSEALAAQREAAELAA
jgi:hypothetical protein